MGTRWDKSIDKETLEEYIDKHKIPLKEIAKEFNYSTDHIRRLAQKYNINYSHLNNKVDEDFFEKETNDLYYVLGVLITDGWVSDDYRIGVELTDKDVIEKISNLIGLKTKILKRERRTGNPTYTIRFTSKKVAKVLSRYNIKPRKTFAVEFPKIPEEYLNDFVRGVFDGDGSVSMSRRKNRKDSYEYSFSIASASLKFLEPIYDVLKEQVNIRSIRIYESSRVKNSVYKIEVRNLEDITKITEWLYPDEWTYGMIRKKSTLISIKERYRILNSVETKGG